MNESPFHPLIVKWFERTFAGATGVQRDGWRAIARGEHTLISAPTGSGKTLAAFLWAINSLFERAAAGTLEERIHVVYVSPLKALGNDIEKNLRLPLAGIRELAEAEGSIPQTIRVGVRSGDTSQRDRQMQLRKPPHILITTPESLYILLTAEKSRRILAQAECVIVDEIHAVADNKRGEHLSLTIERLSRLAGADLQRIGLSATQRPIADVARLLVGTANRRDDGSPDCTIVDSGHKRDIDLSVEVPADFELGPIPSLDLRAAIYDRIASLVAGHRTTIVFTNTRRMVERVAQSLSDRLGKDKVRAHHGSLSRETRLGAEEGLKSGDVPVVVATASLELGIDVGHVDLVCHLGGPRSIAQLLQRVGRSGHFLGAVPKGILFPLTRDELLQCAAAVRAVRAGELDRLHIPENALDVLAQQTVAAVAAEGEISVEDLWGLVRGAWPYRDLPRKDFDEVVEMLTEGVSTKRGRRSAHLHFDRVEGRLRPRRGARLAAITSGGAIPDMADYDVVEDASGVFVGTVNEDFAIESLPGDIFQLGNRSWRVQRVERGRMRVLDAEGAPPTIPFWLGESPGRTRELSAAVADLRERIVASLDDRREAANWVAKTCGLDAGAAEQAVEYVREALAVLGAMPTQNVLVAERFFDEAGGMQLVIHSPFGARLNRAFGLALRKRFCISFDFELQAAATDDGVVLSLGEQHSFPLDGIFSMVHPSRVESDLTQASLQSPMFTNRWRWNATRALAMLRHSGGKRVPIALQRMRAEDLLAAVFPDQLGCQDNRVGNIEPPDHPLVRETLADCLHEAMDTRGLIAMLEDVASGRIETRAVETPSPSALSHEILNANPYAFLDDAPLEERRARAVSLRRFDPDLAAGIGALDGAAIDEVRRQAWPQPRDVDEVHDVLLSLVLLPTRTDEAREGGAWHPWLAELAQRRRAVRVEYGRCGSAWVAAERAPWIRLAIDDARFATEPATLTSAADHVTAAVESEESALTEIVRGWVEVSGPVTALKLADRLHLSRSRIEVGLARLESQGVVMQGRFTAHERADAGDNDAIEWCERGLLARIHRLTIGRLRREIEPVAPADFMRFLFRWQHAAEGTRLHGREGVRTVIAQLGGIELPAPAWERDVLPARVENYQPADLEHLCLAGEVAWGRLSFSPPREDERVGRRRRRSVTRSAPLAFFLREDRETLLECETPSPETLETLSKGACEVLEILRSKGANFLTDIAKQLGRMEIETEDALWELVAAGLVTGDGIAGLRTLLMPDQKRRLAGRSGRAHLRAVAGRGRRRLMPVGRWSLLHESPGGGTDAAGAVESEATRLLARYGVLFRDVVARERRRFPWRVLLHELRRREARGQVRGGRFVDGFVGEQFALPEAVEALRAVRNRKVRHGEEETVILAAGDPLNLVGLIVPGERISPFSRDVVAYRNGVPVETGELGRVRSRLQHAGPSARG